MQSKVFDDSPSKWKDYTVFLCNPNSEETESQFIDGRHRNTCYYEI